MQNGLSQATVDVARLKRELKAAEVNRVKEFASELSETLKGHMASYKSFGSEASGKILHVLANAQTLGFVLQAEDGTSTFEIGGSAIGRLQYQLNTKHLRGEEVQLLWQDKDGAKILRIE